ncbi:hypothetical protein [Aliiroseovarius sp. F47248L]|uniref:hypothetical protein n=1 Tax=Aliiroseovarius sp. F47248L TaxID=2926420 RepID=UPI001FF6C442|nr:hypothetical protein [Aliiroseovarius sp. F47248L]MCK0140435.1 hypothetical protein [Aliiroseovarius sp. F47248L]
MAFRFLIYVLAMLFASGDLAHAGAWPRDKGDTFVSGQVRQDADTLDDAPVASVYGEYGLTSRWTVGGKLDYALATKNVTQIKAFARWHFADNGGPWKRAISLAIEETAEDPNVSPSFHLGRRIDTTFGPGWLDAELTATMSILDAQVDYSAFALVGVKPNPRLMIMVALDITTIDAGAQIDLIPSVAWEIKQGKHLQLEWTYGLDGAVKHEVAAGIWLEF